MSTKCFRGALLGLLPLAAPALPAEPPADGARYLEANAAAVESSVAPAPDCGVSAMEEVRVHGTLHVPYFEHERLRADMLETARVVNERIKASIDTELKRLEQLALPKLRLAGDATGPAGDVPAA